MKSLLVNLILRPCGIQDSYLATYLSQSFESHFTLHRFEIFKTNKKVMLSVYPVKTQIVTDNERPRKILKEILVIHFDKGFYYEFGG